MTLSGKRLLILGGSRISCEIIRQAKKMGIYTGVTDYYAYEKSPAKQMADAYHQVSTTEIDQVVALIKEHHYDGVMTGFTDSVLPHYAEICHRAGLPCYGTKEQFEILINKNKYKKACVDFGVPTVEEYRFHGEDLEGFMKKLKFPVLVKPADSSGARGVGIVHDQDAFMAAYEKALAFSEGKEVLVERFIQAEEVTVFLTFIDGEIYLSGIGNRHMGKNREGQIPLPVAYTFPAAITKSYEKNIFPKMKNMLKSLGIENGMMFMQCFVEGEEVLLYDIGYRLTGSLEYHLLEEICGYNTMEMLIRFAFTGKMVEESYDKARILPYWPSFGCNVSYLIEPGTIKSIEGLEALQSIPGVITAVKAHEEGETLPESALGTLKQIAIRAFGVAKSKEELMVLLDQMYRQIDIQNTEDQRMLLPGLKTEEVEKMLYES